MTDAKKPTAQLDRPWLAGTRMGKPTRYVLCLDCREDIQGENEPDKVVIGHATHPKGSCNRCGEPLPIGSGVAAVTFFDRPEDYEPWEHEHLSTQ